MIFTTVQPTFWPSNKMGASSHRLATGSGLCSKASPAVTGPLPGEVSPKNCSFNGFLFMTCQSSPHDKVWMPWDDLVSVSAPLKPILSRLEFSAALGRKLTPSFSFWGHVKYITYTE